MKKTKNGILLFFFPKINSPQGRLWLRDKFQALYRSILSASLPIVFQSLKAGSFVFDWKAILIAGLTGGLTYLSYALLNGKEVKDE